MRTILVGSTKSSYQILKGLMRNRANVVGVFWLSPSAAQNVSDYEHWTKIRNVFDGSFFTFRRVNAPEVQQELRRMRPDVVFFVGLSQLINRETINIANKFCIGFHPTCLPRGRGRAPIPWMILNRDNWGAATFFKLTEGIDDGPILKQVRYKISPFDYAGDVYEKILKAIDECFGEYPWGKTIPQNESFATYTGVRKPEDGLINWKDSSADVYRLIRATSRPYPGAFTFYKNQKFTIYRAMETSGKWKGVPGRVLDVKDGFLLVMCRDEPLFITDYECSIPVKIGDKLGSTCHCATC